MKKEIITACNVTMHRYVEGPNTAGHLSPQSCHGNGIGKANHAIGAARRCGSVRMWACNRRMRWPLSDMVLLSRKRVRLDGNDRIDRVEGGQLLVLGILVVRMFILEYDDICIGIISPFLPFLSSSFLASSFPLGFLLFFCLFNIFDVCRASRYSLYWFVAIMLA